MSAFTSLRGKGAAALLALVLAVTLVTSASPAELVDTGTLPAAAPQATIPAVDRVVIVIMENRSYSDIIGSTSISMTATAASDPSGVEYFFAGVTGACHSSGWQTGRTYTDTGLAPNTTYAYQVKARDRSAANNETGWSALASATTQPPSTLHVQGITLSTVNRGGGQKAGSAKVTIQDQKGKAVAGATVTGQFTGSFNETVSAITDATGSALMVTAGQSSTSSFNFCVVGVTHPSLGYNPAANKKTCAKR